jgi:hypothetical protein
MAKKRPKINLTRDHQLTEIFKSKLKFIEIQTGRILARLYWDFSGTLSGLLAAGL